MYWPIATPRVYAASSSRALESNLALSQDASSLPPSEETVNPNRSSLLTVEHLSSHEDVEVLTPITPATPAVQSIETDPALAAIASDADEPAALFLNKTQAPVHIPSRDPILALRVSRTGHLFAVITATSMTLWQTKVGYYASNL